MFDKSSGFCFLLLQLRAADFVGSYCSEELVSASGDKKALAAPQRTHTFCDLNNDGFPDRIRVETKSNQAKHLVLVSFGSSSGLNPEIVWLSSTCCTQYSFRSRGSIHSGYHSSLERYVVFIEWGCGDEKSECDPALFYYL